MEVLGSKHFPVFTEMSLEPGAEVKQVEPDASQASEQKMSEKIEDGKEQKDE